MVETCDSTTSSLSGLEELPRKWGWLFALGFFISFAGFIGLYSVVYVTLATVLLFGSLMLVSGVLMLLHLIKEKEDNWQGKLLAVLLALLYIITAVVIFYNPLAASAGFTLVIGGLFLAMGFLRIYYGFKYKSKGWAWLLPVFSGVISIIFALIIAFNWPISGLWVIGLIVSVELIMNGWMMMLTALAARKLAKEKRA